MIPVLMQPVAFSLLFKPSNWQVLLWLHTPDNPANTAASVPIRGAFPRRGACGADLTKRMQAGLWLRIAHEGAPAFVPAPSVRHHNPSEGLSMRLQNRLDVGEFALLAELEPPKGVDISRMVTAAVKARKQVTAFVIPDMGAGVMRMSALGGAMLLQAKGMDTVLQVACRDRNRLALQGDLLAAYGCGITNVMLVKAEPMEYADHPEAKAVDDLDQEGLLRAINTLAEGKDLTGNALVGKPNFFCGATVNPGVGEEALSAEVERLERLREAGVDFFITAPIFDLGAIEPFLKAVDYKGARVIPTVMLLKSVGMARYIQRNMPHMHLPQRMVRRIQKSTEKPKEALRIARESLEEIRAYGFRGAQLAPMGWEDKLAELLEV
jgi:5,10-methylenetetrahydrofolate reductase